MSLANLFTVTLQIAILYKTSPEYGHLSGASLKAIQISRCSEKQLLGKALGDGDLGVNLDRFSSLLPIDVALGGLVPRVEDIGGLVPDVEDIGGVVPRVEYLNRSRLVKASDDCVISAFDLDRVII